MKTGIASRLVVAATLAVCGASTAVAEASLTLTPTSTRCVLVRSDASGTTRSSTDCTLPAAVVNGVGTSSSGQAFIELTYAFSYRDDGLALPAPVTLDTGDYVSRGGTVSGLPPRVTFETATLSVDVTSTSGPNPLGPGFVIGAFTTGAPAGSTSFVDGYLMFGLNNRADNFSGLLTVTVGVTSFALNDAANVTAVSVTPAIAAIPEPSTVALLIGGLVPLALWRRRRGAASAQRRASRATHG